LEGHMDTLQDTIRERYGRAARAARTGSTACCDTSCGCGDPVTSDLYPNDQITDLPREAVAASLGCGNPTSLIALEPGQTVLDLGSGGGIDVLLSSRRVGPTGKVYGLDMTDEMLTLARENQQKAGVTNVEFLKGQIEAIPLPDSSVDVIISNCVINLSADKDRVLREAFRVLKPGGQFAVSDVVVRKPIPERIRRQVDSWTGCLGGALETASYQEKLRDAGFESIEIDSWRVYETRDLGLKDDQVPAGAFGSAFIRARKPVLKACCGPTCCGAQSPAAG
jgi:arsenite methyltransferase